MFTTETAFSQTSGPASAARRLVQSVLVAVAALVRAFAHRREVRKLLDLDERSLRDIGLIRNDVIGALDQPIVKDPSVILLVRSVDRRSQLRARPDEPRRVSVPQKIGADC